MRKKKKFNEFIIKTIEELKRSVTARHTSIKVP